MIMDTENIKIGQNVKRFNNVVLRKSNIGDNSILADDCFATDCEIGRKVLVERRCMLFNSILGDNTSTGFGDVIRNAIIGKYCSIAWNVSIGGAEHPYHNITTHFFPYDKYYGFVDEGMEDSTFNPYKDKVTIGNDVWIAAGAQILRGVTIADGAVIGAGAIVTHDVGPYEIWAGVPAKKIGSRFDERIVKALVELKWWNLPEQIIKDNLELFRKPVSIELINELKGL